MSKVKEQPLTVGMVDAGIDAYYKYRFLEIEHRLEFVFEAMVEASQISDANSYGSIHSAKSRQENAKDMV